MNTINDERETHRNKVFVSRIYSSFNVNYSFDVKNKSHYARRAVGSFLFQGIKINSQTKAAHCGPILFENKNKQIGRIQRRFTVSRCKYFHSSIVLHPLQFPRFSR